MWTSMGMVAVLGVAASGCKCERNVGEGTEPAPASVSKDEHGERPNEPGAKSKRGANAREYIVPLLNPALGRMTYEQAKRELAPSFALTVVEPMPGSLQLLHQSASARVQLDYLPDAAGKWAFADAVVEVVAEGPEQAKRDYGELAAYLRAKLGHAQWEKSEPQYPSSGYRLAEDYAVSLGAIAVPGQPSQIAFSVEKKPR